MIRCPSVESSEMAHVLGEMGLDRPGRDWVARLEAATAADVRRALVAAPGAYTQERLLTLISPAARTCLEEMARLAQRLTVRRFGRTVGLYAPLYLSNRCINGCLYCGFNCTGAFERTRLTVDQAVAEADIIAAEGFRDILLVSSEDPEFITVEYLSELAGRLRERFSSISVEIYPLSTAEYARLFAAGIEGVTLYQETYDRRVYSRYHPTGPKSDYDKRLQGPLRTALAGMRQIGLGVLLGLADWRLETLALAEHAHHLMKRFWQSRISFSFPRLRPARDVTNSHFEHLVSDADLVQMILALRLCFADAGLVLSTRESAAFRDHMAGLGITRMSAGSRTNPGGYGSRAGAVEQFAVNDERAPAQVAARLRGKGLDPVWKDWDTAFLG